LKYQCPGAGNVRTPTIKLKKCPQCGAEVELFSIDMKVDCPGCRMPVFNDVNSCVKWCKYAEDCLGTETYNRLTNKSK
jgi:NADH pyrophosphatase NudC (nudix superfamily)